ncbi:MAG: Holliday junction branch migration protein RuvA [Patescibacteria group bacterium]
MIAYIKGTIKFKDEYFIVERQGLGYKVFIISDLLAKKRVNDSVALFTHEHHKDDGTDLYGFETPDQLQFFEEVISVSGVGPKSGLAMLAQFRTHDLKKSIIHGDTTLLTKVSGIGKKTAERLILELKEKIGFGQTEAASISEGTSSNQALDALVSLGYSHNEALDALNNIDPNLSLEEKVKLALKNFGK